MPSSVEDNPSQRAMSWARVVFICAFPAYFFVAPLLFPLGVFRSATLVCPVRFPVLLCPFLVPVLVLVSLGFFLVVVFFALVGCPSQKYCISDFSFSISVFMVGIFGIFGWPLLRSGG
jgi:hypothetical protein